MAEMAFVWNSIRCQMRAVVQLQLKRVCLNYIYVFKLLHQTLSFLELKHSKKCFKKLVAYFTTLLVESFAGRNFRDFANISVDRES